MSHRTCIAVALAASALFLTGCGSSGPGLFQRTNVAALQKSQKDYYTKYSSTLRERRTEFETAITAQLEADQERRKKMLEWERNLARVEVLLQVPGEAEAKHELLLTKMAAMDLASSADLHKLEDIDRERLNAIMGLYDKLIEASDALKDDTVIADYLNGSDATFAARSIDVPTIVRVTSGVRALDDQLRGVAARSEEQRKKDEAKLQKQLDQAQDVVVKALARIQPTTPPVR